MASAPDSTTAQAPALTAVYTSTTAPSKTFTEDLQRSSTTTATEGEEKPQLAATTDAKVAHLASLRSAVKRLQDDVNVFLTARMDDDKAIATKGNGAAARGTRDEEEDNYGEEVVDEVDA
jgi:hypothetical protein